MGLTQEALAAQVFGDPDQRSRVSTIETASGPLPKPETVRRLVTALGIDPKGVPSRFLWPEAIENRILWHSEEKEGLDHPMGALQDTARQHQRP